MWHVLRGVFHLKRARIRAARSIGYSSPCTTIVYISIDICQHIIVFMYMVSFDGVVRCVQCGSLISLIWGRARWVLSAWSGASERTFVCVRLYSLWAHFYTSWVSYVHNLSHSTCTKLKENGRLLVIFFCNLKIFCFFVKIPVFA